MGLLDGKRLLITGVITDASLAFHSAKIAQEQGATVLISNFGRALGITKRIAKRLPVEPPVIELDVTDEQTSLHRGEVGQPSALKDVLRAFLEDAERPQREVRGPPRHLDRHTAYADRREHRSPEP